MIVQHDWNYYIELDNYILHYLTSVDKLIIYRDKDDIDISVFEEGKVVDLDGVYKHEIVKQIFGGGNA